MRLKPTVARIARAPVTGVRAVARPARAVARRVARGGRAAGRAARVVVRPVVVVLLALLVPLRLIGRGFATAGRALALAGRGVARWVAWIARGIARPVAWAGRHLAAWRAGLRFARYVVWRHWFESVGRRVYTARVSWSRRSRVGMALLRLDSGGAISAGVGRRALPVALMLLVGSAGLVAHTIPTPHTGDETVAMALMEDRFDDRPLTLTPATRIPAAAPPSLAEQRLQERETYAFAPWWTLEKANSFDIRGLTTIAYFGVDVAGNGALVRSGNGWVGYNSQELADLITRAHKNNVRVVLTVKTFVARDLRSLSKDQRAATRLVNELVPVLRAKNFDGVNLDFEGFGGDVRKQFPRFVGAIAKGLQKANEAWQVTIDTYVSSAEITEDAFFDVPAIAPHVDAFFVMGYDMYAQGRASPNAPLPRYESAIRAYLSQVPASKLILGTPFYGYDWPTVDNRPHARAVGEKSPITYSDIVAAGWPRYWDAVSQSPWTAYRVGGQWHEVYYDDPSSIALKTQLAQRYKLRGVGAWALGMEGAEREMITALLGQLKKIIGGPAAPPIAAPNTAPSSSPKASPKPKPKPSPKPSPSSSPSPSPSPSQSPVPIIVPTIGVG